VIVNYGFKGIKKLERNRCQREVKNEIFKEIGLVVFSIDKQRRLFTVREVLADGFIVSSCTLSSTSIVFSRLVSHFSLVIHFYFQKICVICISFCSYWKIIIINPSLPLLFVYVFYCHFFHLNWWTINASIWYLSSPAFFSFFNLKFFAFYESKKFLKTNEHNL